MPLVRALKGRRVKPGPWVPRGLPGLPERKVMPARPGQRVRPVLKGKRALPVRRDRRPQHNFASSPVRADPSPVTTMRCWCRWSARPVRLMAQRVPREAMPRACASRSDRGCDALIVLSKHRAVGCEQRAGRLALPRVPYLEGEDVVGISPWTPNTNHPNNNISRRTMTDPTPAIGSPTECPVCTRATPIERMIVPMIHTQT